MPVRLQSGCNAVTARVLLIRIREAVPEDAGAIARVHVDSWRTTYRGILSDRLLDGLSYEVRERNWHAALTQQPARNFLYVAEEEGETVIGFVAAGKEREGRANYEGEVYAIYILREFCGQGVGRELMQHSAERLLAEGMRSMLLWVAAQNPSRGFYERLGGMPLVEKQITLDGDRLIEMAYGWPDLRALLEPARGGNPGAGEAQRG
jgi:ribosomal protein S18 acetylase RimI-like enzyme